MLSSLNNDKDELFLIPSLDSVMNVSINLVFRTGRNILTSTESGYCQTSANPFLWSKRLTFEHYFRFSCDFSFGHRRTLKCSLNLQHVII